LLIPSCHRRAELDFVDEFEQNGRMRDVRIFFSAEIRIPKRKRSMFFTFLFFTIYFILFIPHPFNWGIVVDCFSGDSVVQIPSGFIEMSDLRVGDYVLGAAGFEPITGFQHAGNWQANYIDISTEHGWRNLKSWSETTRHFGALRGRLRVKKRSNYMSFLFFWAGIVYLLGTHTVSKNLLRT